MPQYIMENLQKLILNSVNLSHEEESISPIKNPTKGVIINTMAVVIEV